MFATPCYKSMDTSTHGSSRENRLAKSIAIKERRAQNIESAAQTKMYTVSSRLQFQSGYLSGIFMYNF
jgi:hypothetical protein